MKISKILAGMSAAAIVASMAMIPASAAACEFSVSDDLAQIGKLSETKDLYAVYFNGKDEDKPNKDAIADLSAVYGASFTIKVDWIGSLQRSNGMRSHMENASATSAAKKSGESTHCKR